MRPDIGLKLFTEGYKNNATDVGFNPNPSIDMDVDHVIAFLNDMQQLAPKKQDSKLELTFEQKYLHKLCDIPNAPEKYFTQFALSLIDALYSAYPKKMKTFEPLRDQSAKKVESMKKILKDFLSSKSSYDAEALKERIGEDTWLTEEYIQVLVKAGKPKEAI